MKSRETVLWTICAICIGFGIGFLFGGIAFTWPDQVKARVAAKQQMASVAKYQYVYLDDANDYTSIAAQTVVRHGGHVVTNPKEATILIRTLTEKRIGFRDIQMTDCTGQTIHTYIAGSSVHARTGMERWLLDKGTGSI